ncbi:MAG: histidine kinase [Bacteroidota bacterium]
MPYRSIIKNIKHRLLFAFISALVYKISVDIILGLIYRNHSILDTFFNYLTTIIVGIIVFQGFNFINTVLNKKTSWDDHVKKRFGQQVLAHILFVFIAVYIPRLIANYFILNKTFFIIQIELIHLFVLIFITLVYNFIELGLFLLNKWRFSLAELERFKIENAEFKFEMLRNQVNPHFLFNSLNTLSSLIYKNPDTAAEYIRKLSRVYRYVLEQKEKELVKLKTELDFIKAYIYLYELRFTNMLTFEININDNLKDSLIAPMTIQMLIENAVKHNIVSKKKQLTIKISSTDEYLLVTNNLQKKQIKEYSTELGLKNIKSRYAFVCSKDVIIEETDKHFTVKIPLINGNDKIPINK